MKELTPEEIEKNRDDLVEQNRKEGNRRMWQVIAFAVGVTGLIIFSHYLFK